MTERHELTFDGPESGRYEIRLRGHLEARWAAWFDGLTVTRDNHGTTVIGGPIADQAALFTSTDAIEAAADAGYVALVDLGPGAVIVGAATRGS